MAKCPFRLNAIPPYNVMDYGAHADGTTNDTDHIQACIDAAVAAGRRVYIPAATYLLEVAASNYALLLPSNLYMYGAGATTILLSDVTYPVRIIGPKTGITLKNFAMNASYTQSGQAGVCMSDAHSGHLFDGLTITNMRFCGIYLSGGGTFSSSLVDNCSVTACGDFGITVTGNNTTIANSVFSDFDGILYPPHGIYITDSTDCVLYRCTTNGPLGNNPSGISGVQALNCTNLLIEECAASNCDTGGADGHGWLIGDGGTYHLKNCTTEGGNETDVYEYSVPAENVTYTGMSFPPFTKKVWP